MAYFNAVFYSTKKSLFDLLTKIYLNISIYKNDSVYQQPNIKTLLSIAKKFTIAYGIKSILILYAYGGQNSCVNE